MIDELSKKEIKKQIEKIKSFLENDASDDWHIYQTLHDEFQQLEDTLKRNGII